MSTAPRASHRAAPALVYVDDLASPELAAAEAHHLARVLRLRAGEQVVACDGAGNFVACRVTTTGARHDGGVGLEALGAPEHEGRPEPPLTVAFALAKGDRAELAVQKLTELGVDVLVPLLTEHTVVRLPGAERQRRGERLRRVAREAAAQSRRVYLPRVEDPVPFGELVAGLGASARLAEPGGTGTLEGCDSILVGPEGGWSDAELACGLGAGNLGDGVLRAETAAIVAGSLLCALRSRVVELAG